MAILLKRLKNVLKAKLPAQQKAERFEEFEYNEDPCIDRLVFICGLHRSGTTLLERLIASHFDISYLRMKVSQSEGQHAQSVYSPAKLFGGPGQFAFHDDMRRELSGLDDYETHKTAIMTDWERFVVGTSTRLIEKSPPNVTKIWWLRKVFPNARFIIITRDPRATSVATQKWSHTTHSKLMDHWHAAYTQALNDWDDTDTMHLRYEDICEDRPSVLVKLEEFLDAPLRPRQQRIDSRFESITNSNPKYVAAFEGRVRSDGVWKEFGYDIQE